MIDPHGKLHWSGPETKGSSLVLVLSRDASDAHLAEHAANGISYVVSEGPGIVLNRVLKALSARFRVRRLILVGVAHMNAAFLEAGPVEEVSPVLFPAVGGHPGSQILIEAGPGGLADQVRLTAIATEVRQTAPWHCGTRRLILSFNQCSWRTTDFGQGVDDN